MLGTIVDKTIKIKPSKDLLKLIQDLDEDVLTNATPSIKTVTAEGSKSSYFEVADLQWLQGELKHKRHPCYIHELLNGCEIVLPEPEVLPRNPELEARVQWLRKEQDKKAYRMMTRNVDAGRLFEPEESIAYQMKQINRQLIAVAQFIFSVAAGFAFGFIGVELMVGDLDFGFRLLLGVICSLVIALAEIYFLAKKLSEDTYVEKLNQE